ncbi:toxin-antitoxin system HicB family antitoxin [Hymenobacter lapidiphilus]|uniref:Toxin-antitoxin system HicB family antitoxin n=1 Tax=Hymenobacter lapidiphilus TaxID=2608003 RepID=A0A7Y7PT93_9BACT|nr:toxin-antitoxin system HicB family antitoxin [Hymenobacter lapidiphilus]NVO33272.1 toxin-antitoxin system HicB family antitoxin [Hymenobacter lapidiphilus]
MKADKTRKPQIGIQVEAEEKELFEAVAKARGTKVASLMKILMHDEARRLGISTPD